MKSSSYQPVTTTHTSPKKLEGVYQTVCRCAKMTNDKKENEIFQLGNWAKSDLKKSDWAREKLSNSLANWQKV